MSLYGALFSGVSGLQSQSSAMGAISDNVSNVNTVGYKGTKVNFQTLVTAQVSVTQYSPGGVQSAPRMNVDIQGLLQATTSSTDFGLSGNGFFVVSGQAIDPSGYAYSRAGSFKVDKDGFLQNVAGYYLQGWPLETWDGTNSAATVSYNNDTYMKAYRKDDGDLYYINDNAVDSVNMQPLNLNTIGGTARASSTLSIGANLPANADIGTTEKTNALIFDSLGNSHNLLYEWTKLDQNTWDVQAAPPEGTEQITVKAQDGESVYYAAGRLDFTDFPQQGETISINGVTYTFQSTAGVGGQVDYITSNQTDPAPNPLAAGQPALPGATEGSRWNLQDGSANSFSTLSGMLDRLALIVESDFRLATGHASLAWTDTTVPADGVGDVLTGGTVQDVSGKTYPDNWVERVAGENAITMRQFTHTSSIAVNASGVTDSEGNPAVLQSDAAGYTIDALTQGTGGDWVGNWTQANTSAVTFDGAGKPATFFGYDKNDYEDPRPTTGIEWSNGAEASSISQFFGNFAAADGLQQLSGDYQLNYVTQNGNRFGNYSGVSVSDNGIVTALFDNGVQAPIFMVPVATFVNPNGMNPLTGNIFQQTDTSGLPTVREAGSAGAATVAQATLESSTVDLGEEFTTMITTQRAYSAAAKIITTSDEMLEELIRIKR